MLPCRVVALVGLAACGTTGAPTASKKPNGAASAPGPQGPAAAPPAGVRPDGPPTGTDAAPPKSRDRRIVVDETLLQSAAGKQRTEAWLIYAFFSTLLDSEPGKPAGFPREAFARQRLAESWQKERPGVGHDAYLDKLVEVAEAGFVDEYTLAYLAAPGWWVPPRVLGRLRWQEFGAWQAAHLADHRVETRSRVVRWGKALDPAPPGSDLPGMADLDFPAKGCSKLLPLASAGLARWEEATRAGPLVISVASLAQVPLALDLVAKSERARRDGVVFATPSVAQLSFIAGACAIEAERGAEAERELERGLAISPGHPQIQSELIHSLIMQSKLSEAETLTDAALTWPLNGCLRALFLRRKGYLLFERGRLVEAYGVDKQSLAYDPGNAVAAREIEAIVQTLKKAGTYDEKVLREAVPASVSVRATSVCR